MEVYSSLVALLPKSVSNNNLTQDSASPASSTGGVTTPGLSSSLRRHTKIFAIPPASQTAVVSIVSELLLSSFERYVTIPIEDLTDREARRKRSAAHGGAGLSQMEAFVEEKPLGNNNETKNAEEEKQSNPFRFEKCISTRPSNLNDYRNTSKKGGGSKSKKKSSTPIGQSLLTEALRRIDEPLPFLVASCITTTPLLVTDDSDDDDDTHSNQTNELKEVLLRIRRQMARCGEIKEYLQWTKYNKQIFKIKDNAKRAEEMAISKLATLVLVAVVADIFLNTCDWSDEEEDCTNNTVFAMGDPDNDSRGSSSSTDGDIADLFDLRTEALDEAAEIMSSFVSTKTQTKIPKKKPQESDVNTSQQPSRKKKGDASSKNGVGITKVKEINDVTRARNHKLATDVIYNVCPAMNHEFLAGALRRFGAEVHEKASNHM